MSAQISDRPLLAQIGKYPVLSKLGEGATSEVYLCHDPFGNRDVAIKVAFTETFDDRERGKLLVQRWIWLTKNRRRERKRQIEETLHRFERFQLAR